MLDIDRHTTYGQNGELVKGESVSLSKASYIARGECSDTTGDYAFC